MRQLREIKRNIRNATRVAGFKGFACALKKEFTHTEVLLEIERKEIRFPFVLRVGTSDLPTYGQVFVENEYDFSADVQPKVIVDAGANVGLASLYFANKYPESKIIAIEPEKKNFEVLLKNVAPYPNIIALNAALWNKKGLINLVDPGLGSWGFMTEESSQDALGCYLHSVEAVSIDSLIDKFQLPGINILKIDIEGAEKEVFADTSAWIGKVDSIIIELHERMKQGCNRSFYNGSNGFDSEWLRGENVYLSKNGYLRQR